MGASLGERRGSGSFQARRTRPIAEINVTPMVDVMLVLLVIFMITAPLLTVGVQVDLPTTKAAPIEGQDEPIAVSIDRRGDIFIQDSPVSLDTLAARLEAITEHNKDARVFVRADQSVPYGQVMTVIGSVNAAGFRKVALLTQPPDAAAPSRKRSAGGRAQP